MADILALIALLCAGCAAGFLAGLLGVGGGIILVPLLLVFYQTTGVTSLVSTHLALGTSLLIIVFASTSSALQHSRNAQVVWKAVLFLGGGSVVGGLAGAFIAGGLEGGVLRQIFAVLVFLSAVQLLTTPKKRKYDQMPAVFPPALVLAGFCVGVVSALAGVGGGLLFIPILHSLLRFPFKKALGTSSAAIVVTAVAAGAGYVVRGWGNISLPPYTLGFVDYLHAVPLIVGSVPLAVIGAKMAARIDATRLRTMFAVLLVVVAFRLFFF